MTNGILSDVFEIREQVMVFLRVEMKGGFVKHVPSHHPRGEVTYGVLCRLFSKCCCSPRLLDL